MVWCESMCRRYRKYQLSTPRQAGRMRRIKYGQSNATVTVRLSVYKTISLHYSLIIVCTLTPDYYGICWKPQFHHEAVARYDRTDGISVWEIRICSVVLSASLETFQRSTWPSAVWDVTTVLSNKQVWRNWVERHAAWLKFLFFTRNCSGKSATARSEATQPFSFWCDSRQHARTLWV